MTEDCLCSDECLAKVRAQVMTRDDSSGGWVAVAGGGMSLVGLRRISLFAPQNQPSPPQPSPKSTLQFIITGHRLSDESICLNCILKRDLQYNQVTPTFRHWHLRGKKFGLTFQSAADAKTFDVAVEKALNELKTCDEEASPELCRSYESGREDSGDHSVSGSENELARKLPLKPPRAFNCRGLVEHRSARPQLSTTSVPVRYWRGSPVNEPAKRILSLPATMTKSLSAPFHGHGHEPASRTTIRLSASHTTHSKAPSAFDKYTYVDVINTTGKNEEEQTTSVSSLYADAPSSSTTHEYTYPSKRDSITSIKIHNIDMMSSHRPPLLPIKKKRGWAGAAAAAAAAAGQKKSTSTSRGQRSRCKYCHEFYSVDGNDRGGCEFAPDTARECIERVSCVPLAWRLVGDEQSSHPCSCDTAVKNCAWRWLALTLMSLVLPCLCCYFPLKGCHQVGLLCGLCGGKHAPMEPGYR